MSRAKVHVDELLRLPFPLPEELADPHAARLIVREVAKLVTNATEKARGDFVDREALVRKTQTAAEKLVEEYFDIDPIERLLIADTNRIIIPSVYSDGLPDAMSSEGEVFGTSRLMESAMRWHARPVDHLVVSLMNEVADWCGDGERNDDVTVLAVEVR